MSLQNYNPNAPKKIMFTYESLNNNVNALKKQTDRTKEVASTLDDASFFHDIGDCKKNTRLQKTHEDNRKKYAQYVEALKNLKATEPPHPNQANIEATLEQIKKTIDALNKVLGKINNISATKEVEFNKAAELQQQQEMEARKKSLEQMQEEQMAASLEHTGDEMNAIQEQAAMLNSLTHQVDDKLTEQHEVVVKIDATIEEAKEEMIAGNADLEEASADQKAGSLIKAPGLLGCCNIC